MSRPESSILQNLPERMRAVRKERGLTQAQFASLGGIGLGAQHRYEAGTSEPSASYLGKLAEAGIDVIFLLTGRRTRSELLDDTSSKVLGYLERADDQLRQSLLIIFETAAGDRPLAPREHQLDNFQDQRTSSKGSAE